jgi:hypothetical protein
VVVVATAVAAARARRRRKRRISARGLAMALTGLTDWLTLERGCCGYLFTPSEPLRTRSEESERERGESPSMATVQVLAAWA